MLTSLFGELSRVTSAAGDADDGSDAAFAATAIMESVATEVNARGQMVDRHSHDLVVSGSPAQAIREHFAATRADLDTASSVITLLDPAGVWASAVIKALSDAGGRPIERLHLREHTTLRTLATIERTTLVRRDEDTLRIYHADVRAPGSENAEIPIALMERSQMTTVIIGPLQPHAIDAMLAALHAAVMLPTWRCPNLLFMLPPNAVWIANKVDAVAWPARLQVQWLSESMTGASSVWNAMLGQWNLFKAQPGRAHEPLAEIDAFPIRVQELAASLPPADATPRSAGRAPRAVLDPARAQRALSSVLVADGLLGCAVVDAGSGLVLARPVRHAPAQDASPPELDIDRVAAACAQLLRAHRQAARAMGLADPVEEVIASAGAHQQILRTLSAHAGMFLLVLLDKDRSNLALARLQMLEVESALA